MCVCSCYLPQAGPGLYDLTALITEISVKDEHYRQALKGVWQDPKTGTAAMSNYKYLVTADKKCATYANLENEHTDITLPDLSQPTPGGGNGVLSATEVGPNGSAKYFQVSN